MAIAHSTFPPVEIPDVAVGSFVLEAWPRRAATRPR